SLGCAALVPASVRFLGRSALVKPFCTQLSRAWIGRGEEQREGDGMKIGYTMMCEQRGPKDLVDDVVLAEQAGFDFSVISDHYSPWLEEQGHSPYAWSVLGAAAAKTSRIGLMTYVTCPTFRYHPAVVAQKAATLAVLSDGRF